MADPARFKDKNNRDLAYWNTNKANLMFHVWDQTDDTVSSDGRIAATLLESIFGGGGGLNNQGSVAFQGASGLEEDNANFFWDNTLKSLGIGTNSLGGAASNNSMYMTTGAAQPSSNITDGFILFSRDYNGAGTASPFIQAEDAEISLRFPSNGVLFGDANQIASADASNLHWDYTLNRLGVGTNSPDAVGHFVGPDALEATEVLRIDGTGGDGWSFRADNTQYFEGAPMLYVRSDAGRERLIFAFEAAAEGSGSVALNGSFLGFGINNIYTSAGGAGSAQISGVFGVGNTMNNTNSTGGNYIFGANNVGSGTNSMALGFGNTVANQHLVFGRSSNIQGSAGGDNNWISIGNGNVRGGAGGGPDIEGMQIGHGIIVDQGSLNTNGTFLFGSYYSTATVNINNEFVWDTNRGGAAPAGLHFRANNGENVLFLGRNTSLLTIPTNTFSVLNGVAPDPTSDIVANAAYMHAADVGSVSAMHFTAEDGSVVRLYRESGTGETAGFTPGTGTGINDDSTFTGNVGATAYRISDIVKALKNIGLLAQ